MKGAIALWKKSKGVGLRPDDTPLVLTRYLKRNPGISQVLTAGSKIIGTVLGGHDGRRGIMAHLAVEDPYRRGGWGQRLVRECLKRLEKAGIARSYVMVFKTNRVGGGFWKKSGWKLRDDLDLFVSRFRF